MIRGWAAALLAACPACSLIVAPSDFGPDEAGHGDTTDGDEGGDGFVERCTEAAEGRPCDDGDSCTTDDRCVAASCAGDPLAPPAPAPRWPHNGAETRREDGATPLRFEWDPGDDGCAAAVEYELQIDDACATPGFAGCSFPSPIPAVDPRLAASVWQTDGAPLDLREAPPVGGRYFWRVRAWRGPTSSDWSPVRYADVGRPRCDLNGDGYSDVVAGAPFAEVSGVDGVGKVYVYWGAPGFGSGGAPIPSELAGTVAGGSFGYAVTCAGDVNADGYDDLLVGCPAARDGTGSGTGRAYLYVGGPAVGPDASLVLSGASDDESFGWAVAAAGDADGDGFGDFLVGSPRFAAGNGRVTLYSGAPGWDDVADLRPVSWIAPSGSGASFGKAIAGLGDLDGDGYGDLAVGDPGTGPDPVCVYAGPRPAETALCVPREAAAGILREDELGRTLAGGEDLDGDRFADLLAGAPLADGEREDWGIAVLLWGNRGRDMTAIRTIGEGRTGGPTRVGQSLAAIPWFSSPERSDVALSGQGPAVFVVPGSSLAAGTSRFLSLTCDEIGSGTGADADVSALAYAGDVNGDGHGDLVAGYAEHAGSRGAACVFFGAASEAVLARTSETALSGAGPDDQFGFSVW